VPASEEVPEQEPQQELDLNVYEDDDDETLHRKLIAAKIARKRAEEDHRLLSNRIALLKQEEQKVGAPPSLILDRHGKSLTKLRSAQRTSSALDNAIWRSPLSGQSASASESRRRPCARKLIDNSRRASARTSMPPSATTRTKSVATSTISNKKSATRRISCKCRSIKSR
jgi:hypothetical protein